MKILMHFFLCLILMSPFYPTGRVWGHKGDNTITYGYIRVDNNGLYTISTRCYNKDGNSTSSWKRTPYNQFRSCHGAYMRIDLMGSSHVYRIWRHDFNCGKGGLYISTLKSISDPLVITRCK